MQKSSSGRTIGRQQRRTAKRRTGQRKLELVLAEWLSAKTVTTLLGPKATLVDMCRRRPRNDKQQRDKQEKPQQQFTLRVEAYASGVIVVPYFSFNDVTSTAELFDVVQEVVGGDEMYVRLLLRDNTELIRAQPLMLVGHYGMKQSDSTIPLVVFAIVHHRKELLQKGEGQNHCDCDDLLLCPHSKRLLPKGNPPALPQVNNWSILSVCVLRLFAIVQTWLREEGSSEEATITRHIIIRGRKLVGM